METIKIDKYTLLKMDEYENKDGEVIYSVVEGHPDGEKFYPNFCLRKFGKDAVEKNSPVSVRVGDNAKRIEVGLWLLKIATGKDYAPMRTKDEDVPF